MLLLCLNTCKLLSSLYHTNSFRVGWRSWPLFLALVCGGAFTLIVCLHINSDCVGARSLLSKDVGEEAMTCELLPAAWLSAMRLVFIITKSPRNQVFFCKLYLNDAISSENLPFMLVLCLHTCYGHFKADIVRTLLHTIYVLHTVTVASKPHEAVLQPQPCKASYNVANCMSKQKCSVRRPIL